MAAGLPEPDKLPNTLAVLPTAPRLEAKGLLVHGLFLGSLAAAGSVPTIDLSASQLFDLANALDEYHNDLVVLPAQFAPVRPVRTRAIAGIAAALVAVVGATYASRQLFAPPDPEIASESLEPARSPAASQREPGIELPAPPPVTVVPNPKLDSPLASGKPLPPPPAVAVPQGWANLPRFKPSPFCQNCRICPSLHPMPAPSQGDRHPALPLPRGSAIQKPQPIQPRPSPIPSNRALRSPIRKPPTASPAPP
ncbi:MAG: DUF4335 domain-containing protein [Chloroflexaceae bacterium]|nr:DUF4335 domain-containing protein [Chloroflexaceae bacterium]